MCIIMNVAERSRDIKYTLHKAWDLQLLKEVQHFELYFQDKLKKLQIIQS